MSVAYKRPEGGHGGGGPLCGSKHPSKVDVFCRRLKHDEGDHSAFVFSIKVPETWPCTATFA